MRELAKCSCACWPSSDARDGQMRCVRTKQTNFKQIMDFDNLISDQSFTKLQVKDFENLVKEKMREVANTTLTYAVFFIF